MATNTIYINHTGHVSVFKAGARERFYADTQALSLDAKEQRAILDAVALMPEVEFVAKYLWGQGLIGNGCASVPFQALGIDDTAGAKVRSHPEVLTWTPELNALKKGKPLTDSGSAEDGILITSSLAELLNKPKTFSETSGALSPLVVDCALPSTHEAIAASADTQLVGRTFAGDFSAIDSQVVGHFSTGLALTEDTGLQTRLSHLQKLLDTDRVAYFGIFLKDRTSTRSFASALDSRFRAQNLPFEVLPFSDERVSPFYAGVMSFLRTMALFFFLIVAGMISVAISGFITMGLMERRREMGTLRAIGFTARAISHLFLKETFFLVLSGVGVGVLASTIVVAMVNRAGLRYQPPGVAGDVPFLLLMEVPTAFYTGVLVAAIGLASAWWKLKKLSQEKPVELLQG